ncbi:type IV secretion system protein VirB4 [Cetobacterium ceti]|uniref:Type IV secretion system protein VirB4 n=1 Tax=Cetobacterium ceti TaxID=180163 RepID=A0A1T4QRH6_9FUSO|nr:DUF87 domain-containing protein [Cetobacterium ceti]SKA06217.1 type IV secretion system protein VirB4 [Cetobacterium ceti]
MINEFKKRTKLSDEINWLVLKNNGIVLNKNGSYQKTFKYRGFDLISYTEDQIKNLVERSNNLMKRIEENWTIHTEVRRKKAREYIDSNFEFLAGQIIEKERKEHFIGNNAEYYINEYYVTLTYLVPRDLENKMSEFFVEKKLEEIITDESLEDFKKSFTRFLNLFKEIFLEAEELTPEETISYLHSCVSEKQYDVKVPQIPFALNNYLCDSHLLRNLTEIKLGSTYIKAITLMDLPNFTQPCILDELNNLPFEYRWVTRYKFLSKQQSLKKIEKKYRATLQGKLSFFTRVLNELSGRDPESGKINLDAVRKADEIEAQQTLTQGDYLSQGLYNSTIFLSSTNKKDLEKKVEHLEKILENKGFILINETVNCREAFLGAMPGDIFHNQRDLLLNTLQFTHLFPMTSIWNGEYINKHLNAPALLFTETDSTNPFLLNLHVGDVGHTAVVGPTGSGKSVFLAMLYTQFMKYDKARVFIFDKGASSKVPTYAHGGRFYDLGVDDTSFQPFRELGKLNEDILSEEEQQKEKIRRNIELEWAFDWVLDIFNAENKSLTPSQKEKIWEALVLVADSDIEYRTLTTFTTFLADPDLKEALNPYLITGPLGKYFDSNNENIKNSNWNVFEMNQILSNKKALVPLLMYLFHKIEIQLNGDPTLLVLDECWAFFDNPVFADKIREWLKVLRRKNTSVVFATQELGDILNSPLFTAVNDACKTKIFLANPNAKTEIYIETYKKFSLNNEEIDLVATATEKRDYLVKIATGYARKFSLAIGKQTLKLVASSRAEELALADEIMTRVSSPDEFTTEFLRILE